MFKILVLPLSILTVWLYYLPCLTSCKELTHWKRLWCWEGLRVGGKGDNRGWDGWMASPTWWMWVWVNSWNSLRLASIKSVMPSSHLILCHPLLFLPPIPPSIRVFSSESTLRMRWPKYWSFSFGISPSNEHPGLISFRMDWLDLLAVQGTLKSLLQHHSSKASILQHSAFFTVQLSHPYVTTGKTTALTRRTFVGNNAIQNKKFEKNVNVMKCKAGWGSFHEQWNMRN